MIDVQLGPNKPGPTSGSGSSGDNQQQQQHQQQEQEQKKKRGAEQAADKDMDNQTLMEEISNKALLGGEKREPGGVDKGLEGSPKMRAAGTGAKPSVGEHSDQTKAKAKGKDKDKDKDMAHPAATPSTGNPAPAGGHTGDRAPAGKEEHRSGHLAAAAGGLSSSGQRHAAGATNDEEASSRDEASVGDELLATTLGDDAKKPPPSSLGSIRQGKKFEEQPPPARDLVQQKEEDVDQQSRTKEEGKEEDEDKKREPSTIINKDKPSGSLQPESDVVSQPSSSAGASGTAETSNRDDEATAAIGDRDNKHQGTHDHRPDLAAENAGHDDKHKGPSHAGDTSSTDAAADDTYLAVEEEEEEEEEEEDSVGDEASKSQPISSRNSRDHEEQAAGGKQAGKAGGDEQEVGPDVMEGKWRLTKTKNYEEYLKAAGINVITRNIAPLENWVVEFKKQGDDSWKVITTTTLSSGEWAFKFDEDTEEVTLDGRKCKTTMSWNNGVLTQKRAGQEGAKGGIVTRKFLGDKMELVAKIEDIACVRIYERERDESTEAMS